jgi:very-short-patch-repair endonuclease
MILVELTKTQFKTDPASFKPQANQPVMVKCDYCGLIFETLFNRWKLGQKHNPKTSCKSCRNKKRVETTQMLHGVKNVSELPSTVKKRRQKWDNKTPEEKKVNQDKVEAGLKKSLGFLPFKNPDFQKKIRENREKKTGYDNPWKDPEVLKKRENTFKKKYGTNTPAKALSVRQKIRETRVEKKITRMYQGKYLKEVALENGFAYSTICARIKKYGIISLENLKRKKTDLEHATEIILEEIGVKFEFRKKINNREIDFFITSANVGIEVDGLYWHSDAREPNTFFHKQKREHFKNLGIPVLFFRENEVIETPEIVKSIILNKIGRSEKIGARKTTLVVLDTKEAKIFFKENHLMGKGRGKTLALKHGEVTVAAMQYFLQKGEIEISRFSTRKNTQVVGGLSKLLKRIRETNPKIKITSFVDLRYGDGKSLETLGFTKTQEHLSFKWVKGNKSFHRLTYHSNTGYNHKMHKLWDCGQAKFEL